jgi:pSer/pThr/pTyr-binding forkhead associated (FHA) protein
MRTRSSLLDGMAIDGGLRALVSYLISCMLTESSQHILDDPVISNKHLRVYSVVYSGEKPNDVAPLVYAEDLSRNGTFWNGSLIGKGNGGFLLSDKDTLRVSAKILFVYHTTAPHEEDDPFDLTQEYEMKVGPFHGNRKAC